jgi:outer membrane protein OmpA-like peptidoglycan-associated protein
MKKIYTPLLLLTAVIMIKQAEAQYNNKPVNSYESNWQLNAGIGYGTYYGDMSRYNIRSFSDAGKLTRFLNYNQNYIKEPSFHLSVVKRLGLTSTGIGLNLSRTLIQGSDRYVTNNGKLQTNDANFSRSLNFKTDILDAGFSINLNSFNKGFFTPYLNLGAGLSFFDVRGDLFTGPNQTQPYAYTTPQSINDGIFETRLRDELTETDQKYPNTVFYAQALLGFNFRLSNNFSLGVESDIKYSGSDYLDDLSGRYKTIYINQRSQYIARPGYNIINPQTGNRGRNDDVNDFYIQNRIVFRFHIPKYLKRAEVKKISSGFNAPILYPNNYNVPIDSSAYIRSLLVMNNRNVIKADSIRQRRIQDSLAMRRMDSARADSIRRTAVTNVKMDSSFTSEVKALRQEIAGLRQTIDRGNQQNRKDSIALQRATLKDSLTQNLQKLQQKRRKTATDSLQQQIFKLRLDSIALAEKYAVREDTLNSLNEAMVTSIPPATNTAIGRYVSREDSLQRVIDSLRTVNTSNRPVRQTITQPQSIRTVRTVRDTLSPVQVQQYQQQVAGLAYRSRQNGVTREELQRRTDSINRINAAISASDSLKLLYYQNRLVQAQQEEEEVKRTERRGLLVKKSEELREAEKDRKEAEERLQAAQASRQQAERNSRVAAGDTIYITNMQAQLNRRQIEIDSLKRSKKALDIFSDKNQRIKELEQQQKDQQRQIDEANRMLQYYRNIGPTSYYQPDNNDDRRRINNLNDRIDDLQDQRYNNYRNPPVNVVSPVVVSENNDERRRMQREIDSLRNQVARLQQARQDTIIQQNIPSVIVDSVSNTNRPVIASNTPSAQMEALQRQLAELNTRLNAITTPATTKQPPTVNDTALSKVSATVYFSRGSTALATLQKAKLNAVVKNANRNNTYDLIASSDNTTGNIAANEALAQRRAGTVAAYLRSRGVVATKITTSLNAITATPGDNPDPLARKVDVIIK